MTNTTEIRDSAVVRASHRAWAIVGLAGVFVGMTTASFGASAAICQGLNETADIAMGSATALVSVYVYASSKIRLARLDVAAANAEAQADLDERAAKLGIQSKVAEPRTEA
jgi:hypothetical protein